MCKRMLGLILGGVASIGILGTATLADTAVQITRTITSEQSDTNATPLTPDTVTRSETLIESERSLAPANSTTTIISEKPMVRLDYQHRLDLLKDQMDNAIEKGWVGSSDAALLQNHYSELVSSLILARAHGFPTDEALALEKQFNAFNIELSDKMAANGSVH